MLVNHLTTPMFSKISMTSMTKHARSGQCYSFSIREGVRCSSVVKSVRSWCNGSLDRSFMVDPLKYSSFHQCNKGHCMCYPVCGMIHIKEPLLLIRKSSPCGSTRFPLLLSE